MAAALEKSSRDDTQLSTRGESPASPESEMSEPAALPLWTKATVRRAAVGSKARLVMVMRSAERIDSVFPDWRLTELTDLGRYEPTDANMPLRLARDSDDHDSPITEMGKLTAQMVGRALLLHGVTPGRIVVSPALHAVQTAVAVASMFGRPLLQVEPGLFDSRRPQAAFHTADTLFVAGFPVDTAYQPLISRQRLLELQKTETPTELYARLEKTMRQLCQLSRVGPLLIVGHAVTVDAVRCRLIGRTLTTPREQLGAAIPCCSLVPLLQTAGKDNFCCLPAAATLFPAAVH